MDGAGFPAMASAASVAPNGIARSAFIAAARHFLQNHEHQQQFRRPVRSDRLPQTQSSKCSSCNGGFGFFGAGIMLTNGRKRVQCRASEGDSTNPLEHKSEAPASTPKRFGVGQLKFGASFLAAAAAGEPF
jgi:hypothetical protein